MDGLFEQPSWKSIVNWTAAVLIAVVFLAAGLFHTLDPIGGAVLMTNLKVPQAVSIPFTVLLGIIETFTVFCSSYRDTAGLPPGSEPLCY